MPCCSFLLPRRPDPHQRAGPAAPALAPVARPLRLHAESPGSAEWPGSPWSSRALSRRLVDGSRSYCGLPARLQFRRVSSAGIVHCCPIRTARRNPSRLDRPCRCRSDWLAARRPGEGGRSRNGLLKTPADDGGVPGVPTADADPCGWLWSWPEVRLARAQAGEPDGSAARRGCASPSAPGQDQASHKDPRPLSAHRDAAVVSRFSIIHFCSGRPRPGRRQQANQSAAARPSSRDGFRRAVRDWAARTCAGGDATGTGAAARPARNRIGTHQPAVGLSAPTAPPAIQAIQQILGSQRGGATASATGASAGAAGPAALVRSGRRGQQEGTARHSPLQGPNELLVLGIRFRPARGAQTKAGGAGTGAATGTPALRRLFQQQRQFRRNGGGTPAPACTEQLPPARTLFHGGCETSSSTLTRHCSQRIALDRTRCVDGSPRPGLEPPSVPV